MYLYVCVCVCVCVCVNVHVLPDVTDYREFGQAFWCAALLHVSTTWNRDV